MIPDKVKVALENWRDEYSSTEGLTWYDKAWMASIVDRLDDILRIYEDE